MTSNSFFTTPGTVYFIGAGPGAPDLITVRGQDIIAQADLILYADSLVEESVAQLARKPAAHIVGSSGLHLDQILEVMVDAARSGSVVARIHSGDPALYGAIHEQMAYLDDEAIPYEIIPGVTAAFAAAARLKTELTIPDVVQTIILTRTAGRTTMPAGETLRDLATHGASLAIYLSVSRMRQVVDELLAGGYGPEAPVAVLHKVTWPDEGLVLGALADIADKVRQAGYTKHALVLISPALDPTLKGTKRRTSSHLYDKTYTHRFRKAEGFRRGKERREAQRTSADIIVGDKHLGHTPAGQGMAIIAITRQGSQLALTLAPKLNAQVSIPTKFNQLSMINDQLSITDLQSPISNYFYPHSVLAEIRRRWSKHRQLVLIMPTGVAVRAIAPLLAGKTIDPAVVCLDEAGRSVIPLLGGHQAGANALAQRIAEFTGGHAALTTASDVQGKPALDLPPIMLAGPGADQPWRIHPASALTQASACLVNDEPVGVYLDPALAGLRSQTAGWLDPVGDLTWLDSLDDLDADSYAAGLIISHRLLSDHHHHLLRKSVWYLPPVLVAGLGCMRGVPVEELRPALETTLAEADLAPESLAALATVDLKADEAGLGELAAERHLPLRIVEKANLAAAFPRQEGAGWSEFSLSAAQDKFDLPGVAEPCARLVAGAGSRLIVLKRSFERCTVAIALAGQEAEDGG
jgi:precorrin-4 C11-methyltransferase